MKSFKDIENLVTDIFFEISILKQEIKDRDSLIDEQNDTIEKQADTIDNLRKIITENELSEERRMAR